DNLDGGIVGVNYFAKKDLQNVVVVSPDAGGVYRCKQFRERFKEVSPTDEEPGLAMIIKQRSGANKIATMDLVGSVDGCDVIIVDDMIDTAGTLCKAAAELKRRGAKRVYALASHGLFSGNASANIEKSCLEEVVVLNTVPANAKIAGNPKVVHISVAQLLADAMECVHDNKSISALFKLRDEER
ncbi:prs, partial [Symbiodinium sp. KB8]